MGILRCVGNAYFISSCVVCSPSFSQSLCIRNCLQSYPSWLDRSIGRAVVQKPEDASSNFARDNEFFVVSAVLFKRIMSSKSEAKNGGLWSFLERHSQSLERAVDFIIKAK